MLILGEPTWIPSAAGRELAAWVHGPEDLDAASGAAPRGVLVLVPPTGRDHDVTYRTLRVLAVRAAQQGWAVVRFAFSATGESSAAAHPEGPTDWQDDLRAVLDFCQLQLGAEQVGGIGLRLGATVLHAVEDRRWAFRLLWEPVQGKRFLRQGAMLRAVSVPGEPVPGGIEHPGYRYSEARAAEVRALPQAAAPEWAPGSEGTLFQVTSPEEEGRLLHQVASIDARVPFQRISFLLEAAAELSAAAPDPRPRAFRPRTEATLLGPAGRPLTETFLRLPDGTPAVLTRPQEHREGDSVRGVVLGPGSSEPKDGPTGLWATGARELAERGVVALRAERPGCGDLGTSDQDRDPNPYTAEASAAMVGAARWLQEQTEGGVTGVGLCASAWQILDAAREPVFERVVAVNNIAWRTDLAFHQRVYEEGDLEVLPESVELEEAEEGPSAAGRRNPAQLLERAKEAAKAFLHGPAPYALYRWLGSQAKVEAPEHMLAAVHPETEIRLVFSEIDRERFARDRGDEGRRRALATRSAPVRIATEPLLDHSLLGARAQQQARHLLQELGW